VVQKLSYSETIDSNAQEGLEDGVKKKLGLLAVGVVACLLLQISAISQSSVSLTGIVSSDAEAPMEGLLLKAKQLDDVLHNRVHHEWISWEDQTGDYTAWVSRLGRSRL